MSRLRWFWKRALQFVGPAGMLGMVLLLGTSVFHAQVLKKQRAVTVAMQADFKLQAALPKQQPLKPASASASDQLAQYYQGFAEVSDTGLADALARLYASAQAESLVLEQGSYRLASQQSGPLKRFDIALPVKGGYLPLRRFINRVLNEDPLLTLESVTFSRQTIAEANVDGQLRFSVYLRKP